MWWEFIFWYLFGFFTTYYIFKLITIKWFKEKWDWDYVKGAFLFATFSWIGFVVSLIISIIYYIGKKYKDEPPKWL